MHTSKHGLNIIMHYEGFSPEPYRCPAGLLTIGYGHVVKVHSPRHVTRAQAEILLMADVASAEKDVTRLIARQLSQNQFDALVSFTFNVGGGALQRSTLRARLNRGEVAEAADQFLRWVYGGGKKLPGLIRRRVAERALFLA